MTATSALAGGEIVRAKPNGLKPFFYEDKSEHFLGEAFKKKLAPLPIIDSSQISGDTRITKLGEEWLSGVQNSLIQFAQSLLAIEVLKAEGYYHQIDVDYLTHETWRDVFRLKKTVVEQLKRCTNEECVQHLNMIQNLFHLWLERVGANSEGAHYFQNSRNAELQVLLTQYSAKEEDAVKALDTHKGFFNQISRRLDDVKNLFKKVTIQVDPAIISRIWFSVADQIDRSFEAGPYRDALKQVIGHLAYSAVNQDHFHLSYPQGVSRNTNPFSPEWRYSEEEWWTAIQDSFLSHIKSNKPVAEYKIPHRQFYASSHSLECYPPSGKRDGVMGPTGLGLAVVGLTLLDCRGDDTMYSVVGMNVGPQLGIQFTWGNIRIISTTPHFAWVSPEGNYGSIKAGAVALVGASASLAVGVNKVALLTEKGFGMGSVAAGAYIYIVPKFDDPESFLGK
jgi:hypothetical protein